MDTSMAYQSIKQSDLSDIIAKLAKNVAYTANQSEPYKGITPPIPATIRTEEEWLLYLARNGVFGRDGRIRVIEGTSKYRDLTNYFPDENVTNGLELAEQKREEATLTRQIAPHLTAKIQDKKQVGKPFRPNRYSYRTYQLPIYLKSAIRALYEKSVETFRRLRGVYQRRSGNANETYKPRGKIISIEDARKRKGNKDKVQQKYEVSDLEFLLGAA